jgi:hypothetical protein
MQYVGRLLALAMAVLAAAAVTSASASAKDDREVRVAGRCTGATDSKLKVKLDDGRIETEFEVDQNRNGQRWRVVFTDNGSVVFRAIRTTRPPSGSFEARRMLADRSGRDRIVATARNVRTGERCRATASI